MKKLLLLFVLFAFYFTGPSFAQAPDSNTKKNTADTVVKKQPQKFEPRKATIRSAIAPGWGQLYNKKYWKAPIVWGALGVTAGIYFYNVKYYRSLKQAYIYKVNQQDDLIDPEFQNLSAESIRSYRNSFRQNVDYSVLFFILFWGLNVVDATVDAHLKAFDVDDNLSLQIKAGYSEMANTSGISLVLNIGKR
ncbi:MAG: DUF5683 domain-containing protein [Bacteroidota bacterium]